MQKTMSNQSQFLNRFKRTARIWLNRKALMNRLVTILIGLGAVCGVLTYAALTNVPPFGDSSNGLIVLLNINLIILLTLLVLVSRRIIALYIRRKRGIVGSNLHIRLVFVFSLLAALPAMFMAVFSVGFFYLGLHGWLDERVRTAIFESQAVAEAYLQENQKLIRADVLAMGNDLDRQAAILTGNDEAMQKMLETQSFLRNFSNIHLFTPGGRIIAQASFDRDFKPLDVLPTHIDQAIAGDVVTTEKGQEGMSALIKLNNYLNLFGYVERAIDPKVLGHVERAREGVAQYQQLQKYSTRLQILLTSIYVVVTLLLTVAATWFGLSFARRLMRPITDLINASEQAREGDLSVRVDPSYAVDEFKVLGHAFNRMTEQIETQQSDLMDANTQMDFRRRFTETILGGVSTGVLSVNSDRVVTLSNNAAGDLLLNPIETLVGQKISYLMPDLGASLDEAFQDENFGSVKTCEIKVRRQDNAIRTFLVRIVVERLDNQQTGAIITFDDLTTVLANQRKAAWADIARRIAHEIKNPLTPIQLSAERLNRKYRKDLDEDAREVFDHCTETIIRHVGDIKTMVNSFSEFAKMPEAVLKSGDIMSVVHEIVTLHKQAHSDIQFDIIVDQKRYDVPHDAQQIRQVLNNLIKNAEEAMDDQEAAKKIGLYIGKGDDYLTIAVADTGVGLPQNDKHELSEPYVTHKEKGTGLGLAIVKKIAEDHNGTLIFNPTIVELDSLDYSTIIGISIALGEL
jgi:two-component system nitrogen regulation sensor histidine kinase NtrY